MCSNAHAHTHIWFSKGFKIIYDLIYAICYWSNLPLLKVVIKYIFFERTLKLISFDPRRAMVVGPIYHFELASNNRDNIL